MRRAPLPMLLASLLLVSQAPFGAGRVPDFDGNAESGLSLRLLLLGEDRASQWPLSPPLPAPGHDVAALVVRSLIRAGPAGELRRRLSELSERLKRHEPPLSIDLTFHLLRQMLEISRAQSQQEQAEQNRIYFDSLGK
ncbi:urocortin [Eublepharis macularius]|uniref:Urocortin n=1 Tax=Eublepharis macularius TaxID=481883 RepID=A0AA97LE91_EUBMA|nr:urocortin [Eublepharis macularius]